MDKSRETTFDEVILSGQQDLQRRRNFIDECKKVLAEASIAVLRATDNKARLRLDQSEILWFEWKQPNGTFAGDKLFSVRLVEGDVHIVRPVNGVLYFNDADSFRCEIVAQMSTYDFACKIETAKAIVTESE